MINCTVCLLSFFAFGGALILGVHLFNKVHLSQISQMRFFIYIVSKQIIHQRKSGNELPRGALNQGGALIANFCLEGLHLFEWDAVNQIIMVLMIILILAITL